MELLTPEAPDEILALWHELVDRLGDAFFVGHGGVQFEWTAKGRPAIRVGPTTYFADAGRIVAALPRGGRAEYAEVLEDGALKPIGAAPLSAPEAN